jgi:biopolymer transport protein ExbB
MTRKSFISTMGFVRLAAFWLTMMVASIPCSSFAQEEAVGAEQATNQSQTLWEMFSAGGPLVLPILVCSFVLLAVVFERTLSLRRGRVAPRVFVERFLLQIGEGALDKHQALERCEQNRSHIARVFEAAVWKWGKPAVEIEQAVLDEGERVANEMRRYLRVVNGVSTVCPLFGLLGTVLGMMESFEVISQSAAMGRAELLAGGIGHALISTAAGLSVAIPALILYLWLVGRVDGLVMEIDRLGQQVVHLISAEGIDERRNRPKPTSKTKKVA